MSDYDSSFKNIQKGSQYLLYTYKYKEQTKYNSNIEEWLNKNKQIKILFKKRLGYDLPYSKIYLLQF